MISRLKGLSYEGRLRKLRVFSLEKREVWGDLPVPKGKLEEGLKGSWRGTFDKGIWSLIGQGIMAINRKRAGLY